jgi:hypothetical protein
LQKGSRILLPGGLVEIRSQEPTRLVFQQGIDACRQFAAEVVADHRIRQREEFPIRTRLGIGGKPAEFSHPQQAEEFPS